MNNDINHLKRQCYVYKFREFDTNVKTKDGNVSLINLFTYNFFK